MTHIYLPAALVIGIIFMHEGMPMTYASEQTVTTLEPGAMGTDEHGEAKPQNIIVGPVAAVIPIKMLGTNGGGFYGMNSARPLENPTAVSNFVTTFAMMIFPFSLVLMYGRMLRRIRHSVVIYSVMLTMMVGLVVWSVYWDTLQPNPAFTHRNGDRAQLRYRQRYRTRPPAADRAAGSSEPPGRPASRQSGGEGAALRHLGRCGVRRYHHRCDLRSGQRRA